MKILTVLGARPQFVKAATVSRALKSHPNMTEVIVHTGQHFDSLMSDVFFDQLDIPRPDHNLGLSNLSHGAMTGRMMEAIEAIILTERPDAVIVYGDTNSTLAGALASVKQHIPVAHVEAGLRSHNPVMPEEINRILTDRVSGILFCPTEESIRNLAIEGFSHPAVGPRGCITRQTLVQTGDVMYDAVVHYADRARDVVPLSSWNVEEGGYVICTIHRQENTNDPARLKGILSALEEIAESVPVLLPLHPRTQNRIAADAELQVLRRVRMVEPLPYLEMQRLVMGAQVVLTDSGGLQKEAFFHGVPCVTLRDQTEWMETVEAGRNVLTGANPTTIVAAVRQAPPCGHVPDGSLFGAGDASNRIAMSMIEWLNSGR